MKTPTQTGYQKFLEEKKRYQDEQKNKLENIAKSPKQVKAKKNEVHKFDGKFGEFLQKAKIKNINNQEIIEKKLAPDFLKISITGKKQITKKNKRPNDVEVLRDQIANRVSKNANFFSLNNLKKKK
ncbi:hypothetical protein SSABA_v1c03350 [Spiroplasma sabaudiense Ar-1343]|uniref:Uncharacterized protein n=1 Tax=Spiroplasma sabaudiense Ar-1343 TaxID=1276257 RepID=W6AJ58_9MOLU|nr:hypothetical protein [Spiroplasma sabaudiense]AHI53744.1 hypothetical protein SSABA_v1c03350 [Spiroplasma sabaudiense Ar-1343]